MEKNNKKIRLSGKDIIGKKTMVIGEVSTGKTALAAKLLSDLILDAKPDDITVIDFAPQRQEKIGGKLTEFIETDKVKYFTPKTVYTPRFTGKTTQEIKSLAELNAKNMTAYLDSFLKNKTEILVVNDVTLYLQAGTIDKLLDCVKLSETVLITAYYGSRLSDDKGTGISEREKQAVDTLLSFMDLIVDLNHNKISAQ